MLRPEVAHHLPLARSPPFNRSIVSLAIPGIWENPAPLIILNIPTHTYNATGSYTMTLTITTRTGCVKTITIPKGVVTGTKPTADFNFTPNNVCASTPIQFTDNSSTSPGAAVGWNWDFGDGTSSFVQNPSHMFHGYRDAKRTIHCDKQWLPGCISKPVKVLPPVARFGYTSKLR